MGTTDSKDIHSIIDKNYNRKRKYHDNIYGEITVIQEKKNQNTYALKEKTFL